MYENPTTITYTFVHDFGAGARTTAIKPPPRMKGGNIRDIMLAPSETFTQTTTPGHVLIGVSGDDDKYADLNAGAAAATGAYNLSDTPAEVPRRIDLVADGVTSVQVKFVAPTGGTPAGIAEVSIVIDWY